jgi:hypothetical protein
MIWAFIGGVSFIMLIGILSFWYGYQVGLNEGREN